MTNSYAMKLPGAVYSGSESMKNLQAILGKDVHKVALFTDRVIEQTGLLDVVLSQIQSAGVDYEILTDLPIEPTCDQAQQVVDRFKLTQADLIIAVGGGSVMDIAKLASIANTEAYSIRDLLDNPGQASKQTKTLMIPTTAGTGSEATPNSIVLVPEKELKVGIINEAMIADYVILDAIMIKNLPAKIAAATGIDALAHAIECFTSRKANPFSDLYALEALDLIFNNIEKACTDSDALDAKNAMLLASFYGGVAIATSGTTAVHALSYPLGGKYHIPHGVANAMLLVPVMKFNEPECRSLFARIYDRVQRTNETRHEAEKSDWVIQRLSDIVTNLEIPTSLESYHVPASDLEILVEAGMNVQRLLANNLREVCPEDARSIYQSLF